METAWTNEASSSFSSSSIPEQFKYDVFLSFNGVDTRNNFTSHLLAALERHGFHTFRDDAKLNRGEYIGYELLKAIEESRISLVVLSKNYAASRWCLDELVKIMECRKTLQQVVLPIFYNVEPSDVRVQKGSLTEAFAKHEECLKEGSDGRVDKWREALTEVANLSGWDVPKVANGDEAKLIQKIVEEVGNILDIAHMNVADHQVGLESRLQKLNVLLNMESSNVCIVGIWGFGGIGKTTIATKEYNLIQHMFEGSSFLANVGETSKQPNGLVALQEQLLSDICRNRTHNVRNSYQGIEVIKRRAFCRKVLLVLDDVDNVQQLKALAIDRDSFGSGSRIIITTRDISLLNLLKVDEIYAPKPLNRSESLELLSWHAFKEDHPKDNYLDLSDQVVAYAGGLPLALEVLGSLLYGKSIPEWKSAIAKLKKIPHVDIQAKLKISFDSLSDEVKELFLDMACFLAGTYGDSTIKILEGCNFFAAIGIRVLADRGLIKYGPCNKLLMHDLVRDMGREIVRQESVMEPGRRSRLWYKEDVLEVLRDGTGTEAVEGLFLNIAEPNDIQVNPRAFEKMNRLWLLHLDYVNLRVGYEHISKRLLWLCWNGFPLKCVPSNLHMENLVTLDLCYSRLKQVWKGTKVLVKLKFLYLSHCYYLTRAPDFSGLVNLEELLLNDCVRLVEVDKSISCLNKLVLLDMKNCKNLEKLPSDVWMLKSLESFDLSGCCKLEKLHRFKGSPPKSLFSFLSSWTLRTKRMVPPASVQGLSCLTQLSIADCNLSHLPCEIGSLISLEMLDLGRNNIPTLPDSFFNLASLKELYMNNCGITQLPGQIESLGSLEFLGLGGNNLISLPDTLCNLTCLRTLDLYDCNVSRLPDGIGKLVSLLYLNLAQNGLRTLPDSLCNLTSLEFLYLNNCNVTHLPSEIGRLISLETLDLGGTRLLAIPDSFRKLTFLKELYMPHCNWWKDLAGVEPWGYSDSNVSHLPHGIGTLRSLACFDLETENNFATNVSDFNDVHEIRCNKRWANRLRFSGGEGAFGFIRFIAFKRHAARIIGVTAMKSCIAEGAKAAFKGGIESVKPLLRHGAKVDFGCRPAFFESLIEKVFYKFVFGKNQLALVQESNVGYWDMFSTAWSMDTAWANQASSSSSPSSIATQFKYDVFLSFSGVDTRKNFTSHLSAALERHGFHTFIDDKELKRGEYISDELLKAIKESRISLVVLSKNYASSRWCLDELVKIMECRKKLQQIVFPIFHGVEPSDVRAQKGSLAEAFAKHEERFKEGSDGRVKKWREALTEVANLSGWDLPKVSNGDEAYLIQKAVEEVQNNLNNVLLHVAWHEVGLESRLGKLKLLLKMETDDVRIVAIWGMGGIGKTTIAKKLYNLVRHEFEGCTFLANISETSKQTNGPVVLQEQLLSDILRSGTHNLRNCHQGIEVIKRRAFCRKVLVILDDVNNVQQLKDLAIDRDSFGVGSRIIVTTRDISSLKFLKVDEIYAAEKLNEDESLELFRWHCFKEDHHTKDHLDLSKQVVHYAGGLPLALEVLGSFFCGKSIPQWRSAIAKLRTIPDDDVQGKLRISFDSLSKEVKELFLDMACFFVGTDQNFTVKILESCNFYAEIGIQVLADRCLVKYHPNRIVMHDLLRDMGREIVRQESIRDPGRRSRLWYHEDALGVLRDGTGTEAVEGLFLNFHEPKEVQVNSKAFEKMNRLWLLRLDYVHLRKGYEHISRRLMWLCWIGFPLKCLPSKLHMENLVTLDLRYSSLKKAWKGTKILVKLKFLYLSYCYHLIETPDFSGLNNLEELLLNDCVRLVEVDESIRFLNKLVILDMKNCKKLQKFPPSILTLKSLESLDLSGCSMLGKFSGFKGSPSKSQSPFLSSWIFKTKRMDSIGLSPSHVLGLSCLKDLRMENCNLSCLPNEVGNLIRLETLDLSGNNLPTLPDSICDLTRLKRLTLEGCNLLHLPSEIGRLISLDTLGLQGNSLRILPDSILNLARLKSLHLNDSNVTHLPSEIGRLISLETLNLDGNRLLTLPESICNLASLEALFLNDCNLSHLPDRIGMLSSLKLLELERNNVCSIPNSFSDLASLEDLRLNDCGRLQSLPQLPVNILRVDASCCTSLENIPIEFNWQAGLRMSFGGCNMLAKCNSVNNFIERLHQYKGWSERSELNIDTNISLPLDEVPNWFEYQCAGSKFSLVVPPLENRRIVGWSFCVVFSSNGYRDKGFPFHIFCNKPTLANPTLFRLVPFINYQGQDQMILLHRPLNSGGIHGGDELEIEIIPNPWERVPLLTVKKCGIHFIYEDITEVPIEKEKRKFRIKGSRYF
ncbi:uncharacterized protein LOC131313166 [Rhododendron vialii]|uniref:uncharacterized protein LOC131313166 n=1 Tax=Rhododendron vialii TaxID=182163 RepID=UPI00265F3B4B|nr:uncharacterized protein LOC131313166 [Rhododendron vialii]